MCRPQAQDVVTIKTSARWCTVHDGPHAGAGIDVGWLCDEEAVRIAEDADVAAKNAEVAVKDADLAVLLADTAKIRALLTKRVKTP